VITQQDPRPTIELTDVDPETLEGEVLIAVDFAGVNYKDAMVTGPRNRVARRSPLIGGVDLAGRVVEDRSGRFAVGLAVLAHGHAIGVGHDGGFAELAKVPADWVVPLPEKLDAKAAMVLGTAGFTAMASLARLEHAGIRPGDGPLLVTGASGGVGSTAVGILAIAGFEVVASTGRAAETTFLTRLGASQVIGRDEIDDRPERRLGTERWAGAVDCVGGATLSAILRSLRYGGAVAASGLTGGAELHSSVYPFIVRNISLLGVDAVEMPAEARLELWDRLAGLANSELVDVILDEVVGLDGVPSALEKIAAGEVRGRIIVDPSRRSG